jgi:Bacterial Ig-like domain (group 1)
MVPVRFLRRLVAPLLVSAAGCGGEDLVLPGGTDPAEIEKFEGDEQVGSAGAPLADSIVVRVLDQSGRVVPGLSIAFNLADGAGGGDVSPDTVLTDSEGLAASRWTLGGGAGAQSVDAKVVGADLSARFNASAGATGAARIQAVSGNEQSAAVGTALEDSLVVEVLDAFGNPVEGISVAWSASTGELSPATAVTGTDGLAATRRILGSTAGTQTAEAIVPGLEGSPVVFTHTATPGTAASLVLISGSGQTAQPGSELPDPLVVRLVDAAGNGIPDRAVSWIVATGGGSVAPTTGNTDADGIATAAWTLGPTAGPNTLNAVVSGIDNGVVLFTATAGSGGGGSGGGGGGSGPSASLSTVSADPTSIVAVTGSSTITVTVRDGSGAPIAGATVSLAASGSGNILTQPAGPTGADGVATGTLVWAVPGTKVVRATVNGSVQINQTARVSVTVAPAAQLVPFEGDDQNADVGTPVPVRPAVRVLDALGAPVAGFVVTFVVTGGGGSVDGASQTTNSDGVARVGSWTLGPAAGPNTLEARAGSLQGSPVVFSATGVSGPAGLVFQVQPTDVDEGEEFDPDIRVAIVDAAGNVLDISGVDIDVDLIESDGEESDELDGDSFLETVNGVAVFPDLEVDESNDEYRLRATAPSLPGLPAVFSDFFDVTD